MDLKDMLMSDETIFKDEQVFAPNHTPDTLLFRDRELQSLVAMVKPGLRGGKPHNALVIGPPGTGKTTTVHFLFDEVERVSDKMVTVHINCKLSNTRFALMSEIHKKIFGFKPPNTGVPYSHVYEKVMRHLESRSICMVVALDDIDFLFEQKHANDILYDILRAYEQYPGARTGVIALLSKEDFKEVLVTKIYSIFMPQEIAFPPYSLAEAYEILTHRAKAGFYPGVLSSELVEYVAELTSSQGDLRIGITLLHSSGLLAESDGRKSISREDIDRAFEKKARFVTLKEKIAVLSAVEQKMLETIAGHMGIKSGELNEIMADSVNKKTFSQAASKLELYGLIESSTVNMGRGKSREFISRFPAEDVMHVLKEIRR